MSEINLLLDTLRQAGHRITPQRRAICELLVNTDQHPTAQGIFDVLQGKFDSLSLATVYNTLDVLVRQGVLNVLGDAGDGAMHYDADLLPHVNLACVRCHKVTDLPSEYVSRLDAEITHSSGYKLLGSRVLYYGVCPDCQSAV